MSIWVESILNLENCVWTQDFGCFALTETGPPRHLGEWPANRGRFTSKTNPSKVWSEKWLSGVLSLWTDHLSPRQPKTNRPCWRRPFVDSPSMNLHSCISHFSLQQTTSTGPDPFTGAPECGSCHDAAWPADRWWLWGTTWHQDHWWIWKYVLCELVQFWKKTAENIFSEDKWDKIDAWDYTDTDWFTYMIYHDIRTVCSVQIIHMHILRRIHDISFTIAEKASRVCFDDGSLIFLNSDCKQTIFFMVRHLFSPP